VQWPEPVPFLGTICERCMKGSLVSDAFPCSISYLLFGSTFALLLPRRKAARKNSPLHNGRGALSLLSLSFSASPLVGMVRNHARVLEREGGNRDAIRLMKQGRGEKEWERCNAADRPQRHMSWSMIAVKSTSFHFETKLLLYPSYTRFKCIMMFPEGLLASLFLSIWPADLIDPRHMY